MSTNTYPLEQLRRAVETLAGAGSIQERLQSAAVYRLGHINPEDLPGSRQQEFRDLYAMLNRADPLSPEGRIAATVSKMSDLEADQIAARIVALWMDVAEVLYEPRMPADQLLSTRQRRIEGSESRGRWVDPCWPAFWCL